MRDPHARLRKLESIHGRSKTCPQCFDSPFRVAVIDGATDEVLSQNFPPSGCPGCGRPIDRELHIIGEGDDAGNGDDLAAKGA